MLVVATEFQHVPIDRHQQGGYGIVGGMLGGHGGDLQAGLSFLHQVRLPGIERVTLAEPERPKFPDGIGGRDDRQVLVQVPRCGVIEVIAMVMRHQDQIDRRQVGDLARWLDLAPSPDTVTQVGVGALVHEGRIRQDRNATEADQRRGIAYEVDLTLGEVGQVAFRKPQYSHRAPHAVWLAEGVGMPTRSPRRPPWSPLADCADCASAPTDYADDDAQAPVHPPTNTAWHEGSQRLAAGVRRHSWSRWAATAATASTDGHSPASFASGCDPPIAA